MHVDIRRLAARNALHDDALVAFRAARFEDAFMSLYSLDSVAASALRSRAHLRTGGYEAAFAAATRGTETDHERGELAVLRATAASRLGNMALAGEAFQVARAYSVSSADPSLIAEVDYYLALDAFSSNDFDAARFLCGRALNVVDLDAMQLGPSGDVPLGHVLSKTLELLGAIEGAAGRYEKALTHLRNAFVILENSAEPETYQEAYVVRNLAVLARDFDLTDDAAKVARRVDSIDWTKHLSHVKFTAVEEIGWQAALRGDFVEAFRRFRSAEQTASSTSEHVLVSVDRAVLGRELGYRAMATEELDHALAIANDYDWNTAPGDSRINLALLAQALVPTSPIHARVAFDQYTAICKAIEPTYIARLESRVRAEEAYTLGLILRAEGRITASSERLRYAFEMWESIGHKWRAARAAVELSELEGGEIYKLAVARELRRRPDSVFAARARRAA